MTYTTRPGVCNRYASGSAGPQNALLYGTMTAMDHQYSFIRAGAGARYIGALIFGKTEYGTEYLKVFLFAAAEISN